MENRFLKPILLLAILLILASDMFAQVTVSKLFRNGAVLQRQTEIPVWGWGTPDDSVSVSFAGSVKDTTVSADGSWKVYLPAFEAGGPFFMTINSGDQELTYTDIMIGDVYLISGQSNMEWSLNASDGGISEGISANYPNIREFRINKATAPEISDQLGVASWRAATFGTAGAFSAVGYYFAKEIHTGENIPIGLVNNSYGGARIEAFMSEQMLGFDEEDITLANGETERQPTLIYNKMVHPILPFRYKGVLWYQAESNGDSMEDALEYGSYFKKMITAWRDSIGLVDLPFLWVQLPNFGEPVGDTPSTWDAWPQLRAQQSSALTLPNTGEAITIDVGGADIHPTNKEPVGYRLSLLARKIIYGEDIVAESPRYRSNFLTDSGTVVINFDEIGSGLTKLNGTEDDLLNAFAIAGENGQFIWANARIEGDQVVVWHDDIPEPVTVRYAWEYNPGTINLYNQEGLPAAPFQASVNSGFKIGSFRSARSAIEQEQSTILSWEVFHASSVTLDGVSVDSIGTLSVSPTETTHYELIAINKDDSLDSDTAHVTIEVLDPSLINRTFGKTVFASTYETCCGDPLLPEFATDEDLATRWSSAWSDGEGDNPEEPLYDGDPDDEWIAVDLGEYIDINRVILNWEAAFGTSYDIEVSLDGYLWEAVFEERNGDGEEDNIAFETPVSARFLRMHGIDRATVFGYSLYEFTAYGEVSEIEPPSIELFSEAGSLVSPEDDSLTISATATDPNGTISSVEFFVDGISQSVDTEAPYSFKFKLTGNGKYEITAIATDDDDISIQSTPLTIYEDIGNFARFEAEVATTTGGATIENNNLASGSQFLNLQDAWTVTFDPFNLWETGEHLINIRYQLNYDSPKSQYLVINGDTVATVEFTAPNANEWFNKAFTYNFETNFDIEIAIHGFWNWMSIDYIEVEGVNGGLSNENNGELPKSTTLHQNYPNPFNPTTVISFELPVSNHILLRVYDVSGQLVSTLADGSYPAGYHSIPFNATDFSSGVYFYTIEGEGFRQTRKMLLIK